MVTGNAERCTRECSDYRIVAFTIADFNVREPA